MTGPVLAWFNARPEGEQVLILIVGGIALFAGGTLVGGALYGLLG